MQQVISLIFGRTEDGWLGLQIIVIGIFREKEIRKNRSFALYQIGLLELPENLAAAGRFFLWRPVPFDMLTSLPKADLQSSRQVPGSDRLCHGKSGRLLMLKEISSGRMHYHYQVFLFVFSLFEPFSAAVTASFLDFAPLFNDSSNR